MNQVLNGMAQSKKVNFVSMEQLKVHLLDILNGGDFPSPLDIRYFTDSDTPEFMLDGVALWLWIPLLVYGVKMISNPMSVTEYIQMFASLRAYDAHEDVYAALLAISSMISIISNAELEGSNHKVAQSALQSVVWQLQGMQTAPALKVRRWIMDVLVERPKCEESAFKYGFQLVVGHLYHGSPWEVIEKDFNPISGVGDFFNCGIFAAFMHGLIEGVIPQRLTGCGLDLPTNWWISIAKEEEEDVGYEVSLTKAINLCPFT